MTLLPKKIPVYTLDEKREEEVGLAIQEELERSVSMENDNHNRSIHTASAAQQWVSLCIFFAFLFLLDDALLFANTSAYIVSTPIYWFSLPLAMAVGITGIGSAMKVFRKSVPMWVRVEALIAFVLALLSLGFYCHWYSYVDAMRCPLSGCG